MNSTFLKLTIVLCAALMIACSEKSLEKLHKSDTRNAFIKEKVKLKRFMPNWPSLDSSVGNMDRKRFPNEPKFRRTGQPNLEIMLNE